MSRLLEVALIGAGSMGTHHARIVSESSRAKLGIIVDPNPAVETLAREHDAAWSADVAAATAAQAAIVASPTETHASVAAMLIESGTPVLIEKPISEDLNEVVHLLDLSRRSGVPIMCGFVERFNPVIAAARSLLHEPPRHLLMVRHSPPAARIRTDVVYDLLIHDLDIASNLYDDVRPSGVVGSFWAPSPDAVNEIVDATVAFENGGLATLSASRTGQRKTRTMLITAPPSQIELDLVRHDITVYHHVSHEMSAQTYRAETVVDIPFVRHAGEPLGLQFDRFLDLVDGRGDADAERASLLPPHALATAVLVSDGNRTAP